MNVFYLSNDLGHDMCTRQRRSRQTTIPMKPASALDRLGNETWSLFQNDVFITKAPTEGL